MAQLSITLIDVGWGDSIFIESQPHTGPARYALIDSNDTTYLRPAQLFLKRFFDRKVEPLPVPRFEFVALSHDHSDHGQGLKQIIKEFGTKYFWYPEPADPGLTSDLLRFARRSHKVMQPEALDSNLLLPPLGDAEVRALWPPPGSPRPDENNNSLVLLLTLGAVSLLLTGDAEADVWSTIGGAMPAGTRFVKVPHHGSVNGTFAEDGQTPWLDHCPPSAHVGISCHCVPHGHPDQGVIDAIAGHHNSCYRTDQHHHITLTTDGTDVQVKYSHEA